MTWHFPNSAPSPDIVTAEVGAESLRLAELEEMEAAFVRNLVTLKERHAFTPNEVTMRQVTALEEKLADIRMAIDQSRHQLGLDNRRA